MALAGHAPTPAHLNRPDLVVRAVRASPGSLRPADALTIRDRVSNRGKERAAKFRVGYYLTRKTPVARIRVGARHLASLGRGKTSSGVTTARLPATLPTGSYRLLACVDDAGKVKESDEADNCATAGVPVRVVPRDKLPPTSKAAAPGFTQSAVIPVDYAADGTGSPLARVELWVRTPGSTSFAKVATDLTPATSAHHFDYRAAAGDGPYALYTRAYDRAGNVEAAPQAPDATTLLDMAPPSSSATATGLTNSTSIPVDYTANGTGSPLDRVELWVRTPNASTFSLASTDRAPAGSGHFDYTAALGDGAYRFFTIAYDKAGNAEPAPGRPDATANLDTTAPTSTATAASLTKSHSIQVGYTGDGTGSALSKVELYAKRPGDGGYSLAQTDSSPAATGRSFTYTDTANDGDYSFYTLAYDQAGNAESKPSPPDATTTLDTSPPSVTIGQPGDGSTTDLLAVSGHTGTASGDGQPVTLKIYSGTGTNGTLLQTPTATVASGSWSATADPLDAGTYTVEATQQDAAGNTGRATHTFTVLTTVLAAGDIAGPPAAPASPPAGDGSATAPLLLQRAGKVLALGDDEYQTSAESQSSLQDFMNWYDKTWGLTKSRTMPVPGNHEYGTSTTAPGYFDYFGPVAGDPAQGYYSYDLGSWHVVALNSNNDCSPSVISCAAGSDQETWLRTDLGKHTSQCILAYWHHPLFSSSLVNSQNQPIRDGAVQALFKALYDFHADIVLNGHQHNYERFALQDQNGNADTGGIREFVVGTGGRDHKPFPSTARFARSEVSDDSTFGILDLTLGIGTYSWKFVPEAGGTFTDQGSGACHNASPGP